MPKINTAELRGKTQAARSRLPASTPGDRKQRLKEGRAAAKSLIKAARIAGKPEIKPGQMGN